MLSECFKGKDGAEYVIRHTAKLQFQFISNYEGETFPLPRAHSVKSNTVAHQAGGDWGEQSGLVSQRQDQARCKTVRYRTVTVPERDRCRSGAVRDLGADLSGLGPTGRATYKTKHSR